MPLPFILAGLALAAAGYGVKKGIDASEKNDEAKRRSRRAKEKYDDAKYELETAQRDTQSKLENLGKLKLNIFNTEIKNLIAIVKECKQANSKFNDVKYLTDVELKQLDSSVKTSLDIISGLANGSFAGALAGFGAYGAVGALATASTGTAIAGLSGAAATNATLAWFGGGALAAGGGGMALGTAVLGGIVAGPLIAVTGLWMDSRAEENLTQAREYESKVDVEVESMNTTQIALEGIRTRVDELRDLINKLKALFQAIQENEPVCNSQEFLNLMVIGKGLKDSLDIAVLTKEGNLDVNSKNNILKVRSFVNQEFRK